MKRYNKIPERHFDYAIVGAGLSGLMLTIALLENEATAGAKILLLDRSLHDYAPRTWCFWEKGDSKFEALVEKQWQSAEFFEGKEHLTIDLHPYAYKMINAVKFREKAWGLIQGHANVVVKEAAVDSLHVINNYVWVSTAAENYTASMVFDSRFQLEALRQQKGTVLYQQFSGWFVQSSQPLFAAQTARLMDFRTEQKEAVGFCYLLPLDARTALVEYTLFTSRIRSEESLDRALQGYLDTHFPHARLTVSAKEKGIIPMADFPVLQDHPRIIRIGTAGGCTKPSSGYTFLFVIQHTDHIIAALNKGETPPDFTRFLPRRFRFYDRVLLRILEQHPGKGAEIFFRLFKRNTPAAVLGFMSNGSSLREEIGIFRRLPIPLFLRSALQEMTKGITVK
jgi:lycopene beta-cyclase